MAVCHFFRTWLECSADTRGGRSSARSSGYLISSSSSALHRGRSSLLLAFASVITILPIPGGGSPGAESVFVQGFSFVMFLPNRITVLLHLGFSCEKSGHLLMSISGDLCTNF
jgi:hypothetical protein